MRADWQTAAERGDARLLRALIEAGADVDQRDRHGNTALMIAAHRGHTDAARTLIAAGADLDRTAKYGLSALMLAIVSGAEEVGLLLIDAGARSDLRGSGAPGFAGQTALDLAVHFGRAAVADALRRLAAG